MTTQQAHALAEKIADRLLEEGLVNRTEHLMIRLNGTSSNSPTTLHDPVRDLLVDQIAAVLTEKGGDV